MALSVSHSFLKRSSFLDIARKWFLYWRIYWFPFKNAIFGRRNMTCCCLQGCNTSNLLKYVLAHCDRNWFMILLLAVVLAMNQLPSWTNWRLYLQWTNHHNSTLLGLSVTMPSWQWAYPCYAHLVGNSSAHSSPAQEATILTWGHAKRIVYIGTIYPISLNSVWGCVRPCVGKGP